MGESVGETLQHNEPLGKRDELTLSSVRVTDEIYVISSGSFPYCNSVAIISDEVILIDPGCSIHGLRVFLNSHDLDLKDIDTVLLSHIHPDHITHAMRINRLSRCRISANHITAPLFNDKEKMKDFLGFHKAQTIRPYWESLVNEKMYGALDEGRVTEVLHDGDKIAAGEVTLRMLYTPGHLPDHMCVEIIEPNLLFASDIDCTEFGPFYGHPNSSIPDFRNSIQKLRETSYDGFISGHLKQPCVENYVLRLGAYDNQFDIREDLVLSAIQNGAEYVDDITVTPIIYPSLTNVVFLQFEKWMIEHHIRSLVEKDLIEEMNEKVRVVRD